MRSSQQRSAGVVIIYSKGKPNTFLRMNRKPLATPNATALVNAGEDLRGRMLLCQERDSFTVARGSRVSSLMDVGAISLLNPIGPSSEQ